MTVLLAYAIASAALFATIWAWLLVARARDRDILHCRHALRLRRASAAEESLGRID